MRILLVNNGGGAVMYGPLNDELRKTLPPHVGAGHHTSARGWVESLGFEYIPAENKEEADKAIRKLCDLDIEHPILVEVFTTINSDINSIQEYFSSISRWTVNKSLKSRIIDKIFSPSVKNKIKAIIHRK